MLTKIFLFFGLYHLTASVPQGKIRLGIFITSGQKNDYLKRGRTWDQLVTSLKTDTQKQVSVALSPYAGFPFNMKVTVTNVVEISSFTAGKWLNETGRRSPMGLLETSKYAKQTLPNPFDIAVLVFSRDDGKKYRPPYGFTLNAAACGGLYEFGNAIHLYGQIKRYGTEVLWHRLLAHELGHQLGAYEGPRDKNDECYDIMSFTPWRIPETQLWKSCSIKRITEVQQQGKLQCLGL